MAGPRILTRRELNRSLLARQLLLERARTPLPRALERVAGIQAQYAPSMYVGLWSRLDGFDRDDLTRALERRSVVQATLMRVTIHLVSKRDYWPLEVAVRDERRAGWFNPQRPDPKTVAAAARKARSALAGGPLSRAELDDALAHPGSQVFNGIGMYVDLVRVPPSGTWERRRADLYAMAEDWLGPQPAELTEEQGIELLVRRRLGGFGPGREQLHRVAGVDRLHGEESHQLGQLVRVGQGRDVRHPPARHQRRWRVDRGRSHRHGQALPQRAALVLRQVARAHSRKKRRRSC